MHPKGILILLRASCIALVALLPMAACGGPQASAEVKALYMEIPLPLAAEWGLDGGPAVAPKETPLGEDIPSFLSAEQSRTVITALRQKPGTRIVGSATALATNGYTAIVRDVEEWCFPESYAAPLPEKDKPKKPSYPEFGEPRDIGMLLEATPQWHPGANAVELQIRTQLNRLVGYTRHPDGFPMPIVASSTAETTISMPWGMTAILSLSTSPHSSTGPTRDLVTPRPEKTEERVTLLFVTSVLLIRDAPEEIRKTGMVDLGSPIPSSPRDSQ